MLTQKAMTLLEMFETHQGIRTHKYPHHLEIYERFFARFKEVPSTVLEIGIAQGGSLELWKRYFGSQARIIGVDIQDRKGLEARIHADIFTGDQANPEFWNEIMPRIGPLDILIDDGSHQSRDQIITFACLFPHLKDGGLYVCEDIHTSYHEQYGGGLRNPESFVEHIKLLIDDIHSSNFDPSPSVPEATHIFAVHVFPSLAIIEKRNPWSWGGSTIRGCFDYA